MLYVTMTRSPWSCAVTLLLIVHLCNAIPDLGIQLDRRLRAINDDNNSPIGQNLYSSHLENTRGGTSMADIIEIGKVARAAVDKLAESEGTAKPGMVSVLAVGNEIFIAGSVKDAGQYEKSAPRPHDLVPGGEAAHVIKLCGGHRTGGACGEIAALDLYYRTRGDTIDRQYGPNDRENTNRIEKINGPLKNSIVVAINQDIQVQNACSKPDELGRVGCKRIVDELKIVAVDSKTVKKAKKQSNNDNKMPFDFTSLKVLTPPAYDEYSPPPNYFDDDPAHPHNDNNDNSNNNNNNDNNNGNDNNNDNNDNNPHYTDDDGNNTNDHETIKCDRKRSICRLRPGAENSRATNQRQQQKQRNRPSGSTSGLSKGAVMEHFGGIAINLAWMSSNCMALNNTIERKGSSSQEAPPEGIWQKVKHLRQVPGLFWSSFMKLFDEENVIAFKKSATDLGQAITEIPDSAKHSLMDLTNAENLDAFLNSTQDLVKAVSETPAALRSGMHDLGNSENARAAGKSLVDFAKAICEIPGSVKGGFRDLQSAPGDIAAAFQKSPAQLAKVTGTFVQQYNEYLPPGTNQRKIFDSFLMSVPVQPAPLRAFAQRIGVSVEELSAIASVACIK
ncbi:hypothetical protein DCS_04236 [Drechmeria coniospora]|uniref:Uncharacterized protein n=1 Tax=Drechmeria coniospora TaxID=98403 RepID=A0A151GJG6_DRECN|nr:hypothetical protein DCS_04236 [Drechmeria coniospora]KYK57229.1 hypothetical protein DCS_04236 [Drechmeria coniospora]